MSKIMGRLYYPVRYRLDHKERWLIWHTTGDGEGADGVVVNQDGKAVVFRSRHSLSTYVHGEELTLTDENNPAFYNLDVVATWLKRKRPAKLDCIQFLNAWNLLADLSATVGGDFGSDKAKTREIYSKLFWGNNLPAITPIGRHYTPRWPGRESRIIRDMLRDGLAMFRQTVEKAK